jgi:hypothetical protein
MDVLQKKNKKKYFVGFKIIDLNLSSCACNWVKFSFLVQLDKKKSIRSNVGVGALKVSIECTPLVYKSMLKIFQNSGIYTKKNV